MSNYPDSSPMGGDGGKGGRKKERNVSQRGTSKNNDGRIKGGDYDAQFNGSGDAGPGMPQRVASRNSKQTFDPNEDAQHIQGGLALKGKRRVGLEEGAY